MPAIDGSSPARFTDTPNDNVDITSASFTPPNDSILVCCVNADTGSGNDIAVSVSGGSLTWTQRVERDQGDGGAASGHASIWTAVVAPGASMTVSVRRTSGIGGTNRISGKVYVVTGGNTSDPVGATGEGSDTANNITPNAYTSTVNNSRGFGCATDWNQNGAPTSSDEEDAADYGGAISVLSLHKAADTGSSGTSVSMNFDAAGAGSAAWNWCAVEIKPAAGGTTFTISLTGSITPTGALVKQAQKPLSGASTSTGAIFKQAQKSLTGAVTPTGTLARQIAKSFTGAITPVGSLLKQIGKFISGLLTPSGAFSTQLVSPQEEIAMAVTVRLVTQATITHSPVMRAAVSQTLVTRAAVTVEIVGG